jgi:uncharacterized protein DUF2190
MAVEIPGKVISIFNATADLSALQYTFVSLTTLGGITGTTVYTDGRVLGILQNTPTSNQAAEVMYDGVSKLIAGTTAIVVGDYVGSTAAGRAVTSASGTSGYKCARVLQRADTSGVMTVQVFPPQQVVI